MARVRYIRSANDDGPSTLEIQAMTSCMPPPIFFRGTLWSSRELADVALAWRDALRDEGGVAPAPIAMVMANNPEAVALFFALSSFPAPLILLPPDPSEWRSAPSIPLGTRLVLPPRLGGLTAPAEGIGLRATVLPDPGTPRSAPDGARFLASPGVVLFTSGSTDRPRPVYRPTAHVLAVARALMAELGTPRGAGIISTLPLARGLGFNHGLIAATVLESPLALLEHFDHNAVLGLFASRRYRYWAGTPIMADMLSRCPPPGAHPAPPTCVISGHLSADVVRRFKDRFAVPLRPVYGTTETASVTVDGSTSAEVRSDTAGRPLPGVELRIGDDPRAPFPAATPGRLWLSAPRYMMDGYGFPPDVQPPESVDGWWPTPDVGQVDGAGYLTILGRLDDCFRTNAGHLMNPAAVGAALETYPGVTDVAAVPLGTTKGPVVGVLVQGVETLRVTDLRRHLARALPAWAQPSVLDTTDALPRLPSGKMDRRACIEILKKALSPEDA